MPSLCAACLLQSQLLCVLNVDFVSMYEDAFCVSPNAWGGVLNKDTIPCIKAKVVCGACNNQLQFASDAALLMQVINDACLRARVIRKT